MKKLLCFIGIHNWVFSYKEGNFIFYKCKKCNCEFGPCIDNGIL